MNIWLGWVKDQALGFCDGWYLEPTKPKVEPKLCFKAEFCFSCYAYKPNHQREYKVIMLPIIS